MENLQKDLILHIFQFLDKKDIIQFTSINKYVFNLFKSFRLKMLLPCFLHEIYKEGVRDGFCLQMEMKIDKSHPFFTTIDKAIVNHKYDIIKNIINRIYFYNDCSLIF